MKTMLPSHNQSRPMRDLCLCRVLFFPVSAQRSFRDEKFVVLVGFNSSNYRCDRIQLGILFVVKSHLVFTVAHRNKAHVFFM